jgi:hypothetical protein
MSWVDILKLITDLLPSITALIQNLLAGHNPVDSKAEAAKHINTLTGALQQLNGPGTMRLLPPEVGDSLRTALTAHAHATMALVRAVVDHQDAIRGAAKTLAQLDAETQDPKPSETANTGQGT